MENRVYKFGCRAPRDPEELRLAQQMLGQAWLYRDEIRRHYNTQKRNIRHLLATQDDASHVITFEYHDLNARIRESRSKRGHLLDAGTYWLIEAAVLAASKASKLDPIKKQHFDMTGRIGAAIQSTEQFRVGVWTHGRVSLTLPNEKKHAELTLTIGEKAKGQQITWPIKLHRPFPEGAVVKQVAVQCIRQGHRLRWEALVTLAFDVECHDTEARGVVGIDIGWRVEREKQRVATYSSKEDVGALFIDALESFEYADAIQAVRDLNFDEAKAYVKSVGLPGTEHAPLWRDKARMVRLAAKTEDLGPVWWRERDKHLEDIESAARGKAVRRRLDVYRCYADRLAKRYAVVALEDMAMSDWVGEGETHAKERRRSTAALFLLQMTIAARFGPARTCWVPAMNTSRTCSSCGEVRATPIGKEVHWKCECGALHHQDENAAKIIRAMGERWMDEGNAFGARKRKLQKGKKKKTGEGIATGDESGMVITPRKVADEAAE